MRTRLKLREYPPHTFGVELVELLKMLSPDVDPETPVDVEKYGVPLDRWAAAPGETAAWRYAVWRGVLLYSPLTPEELGQCKDEWWWTETVMMLNRCPNCGTGWTDNWGPSCPLCPTKSDADDGPHGKRT